MSRLSPDLKRQIHSRKGLSVNSKAVNFDVAIIGGGIHGCSVALHLALQGARVVVLEKDFSGRHASGVNAGGVRRLGRDVREIALSIASLKIWQNIDELVDEDCGFSAKGHVQIAENETELDALRGRVDELNKLGFSHEVLIDRDELRALVPAVAEHAVGAISVVEDGAALPYQTTQAFYAKAERLGVIFMTGLEVVGASKAGEYWRVDTHRGTAILSRNLVNCAGAWAGSICHMLDEYAPVDPIAPMLSITAPMDHFVNPVVSAATRILSFKQYDNGTVLIGGGVTGTVDFERNRAELSFPKLAINARTAVDLFPIMRSAKIVRSWAGIEGRMPDDIPVIGPSLKHENLWHSFGYSAHGFQMAPIAGRMIAEQIDKGYASIDLSEFSIGRFSKSDESQDKTAAGSDHG